MSERRAGKLMDSATIQAELGVKRGAAEAIMRGLEKIRVGKRVYVKRIDVDRYLAEHTVNPDGFKIGA